MFSWMISIITGITGCLVGMAIIVDDSKDYINGRLLPLMAVLFATSAAFRFLEIVERKWEK